MADLSSCRLVSHVKGLMSSGRLVDLSSNRQMYLSSYRVVEIYVNGLKSSGRSMEFSLCRVVEFV